MLTAENVRTKIEGEAGRNRIDKQALVSVLNRLSEGRFGMQLLDQLFLVCRKENGSVAVAEFAERTATAYGILQTRVREGEQTINRLQGQYAKAKKAEESVDRIKRVENLEHRIEDQREEVEGYRNEMKMLLVTFKREEDETQRGKQSGQATSLQVLFYASAGLLLFSLGQGFGQPNFINLLSASLIQAIFLVSYYDSLYFKVCLGSVLAAMANDIAWLVLNFGTWTNPPLLSSLYQGSRGGYIYCCAMTVLLLTVKAVLAAALHLNSQASHQVAVRVELPCRKEVQLGDCEISPVSKVVLDLFK